MEDTDQLLRETTPFIRPVLEPVEHLDLTPTTSPGSTPGSPRRRLARGTVQPPVETLLLPTPALPVRLIDPPAVWGYSQRVDLATFFNELAPVAGEIDTQRVRRIGAGFDLRGLRAPWGAIAAGVGALALVLSALWMVAAAGSTDTSPPSASTNADKAAPVLIVTQLDEEAEPAEIEMPAVDATPARDPAPAATHGTLMIGSKPPCRILIDGKDTGLTTPNRGVRVPAGRHTITLVNRELGISDSSTLVITGGRKAKLIRDFSAQI